MNKKNETTNNSKPMAYDTLLARVVKLFKREPEEEHFDGKVYGAVYIDGLTGQRYSHNGKRWIDTTDINSR